jgi:ADP-ribose pyrophosphatase
MEVRKIRRDVLYRGKVFDLIVDQVGYPSGVTGIREIAHHPGGAVVVPVFPDGRLMLVEQYRYPLGLRLMELPAGKLSPGEDPRDAAARELTEETGWIAGRLEKLTSIYTTPGFCDEELHLFLGTDLHESPEGHRREEGEYTMTVHRFTFDEVLARIAAGELRDGKTVAGVLLAWRRMNDLRENP